MKRLNKPTPLTGVRQVLGEHQAKNGLRTIVLRDTTERHKALLLFPKMAGNQNVNGREYSYNSRVVSKHADVL